MSIIYKCDRCKKKFDKDNYAFESPDDIKQVVLDYRTTGEPNEEYHLCINCVDKLNNLIKRWLKVDKKVVREAEQEEKV